MTDKGYYTNSFHFDVEKKVNPYDKLDFEAPYSPLASGGFICYGEDPNLQHNSTGAGRCLGLQLSARAFNAGKQEEVKRRVKHFSTGELG